MNVGLPLPDPEQGPYCGLVLSSVFVALIALVGVLASVYVSRATQNKVAADNRGVADSQFKTALADSQAQFDKNWQIFKENATTQSTAAAQLDEWRQREETFRMLRWASDHVVSPKSSGEPLMGILVLSELSTMSANALVQKKDEAFVSQVAFIVWGVAKSVAMVVLVQATHSKNKTPGGSGKVQLQLDAHIVEAAILAVRADGLLQGKRGGKMPPLDPAVVEIAKGSVGATIPVSPITIPVQPEPAGVPEQGLEGPGPISKDGRGLGG